MRDEVLFLLIGLGMFLFGELISKSPPDLRKEKIMFYKIMHYHVVFGKYIGLFIFLFYLIKLFVELIK